MRAAVAINLNPIPPAELVTAAILAEALGYESIWMGEHIVIPGERHSVAPYNRHRRLDPHTPYYEPLAALTGLATATKRVKIGTGVLIMPLRDPFLTARGIATADILSGGRLLVGMGVGWLEEEFDLMGTPFGDRGKRFDEQLELMKQLLGAATPEHHGRLWDLAPGGFEPKPVQRPRPPFLVGGISDAAIRRCAAHSDGWFGSRHTPEEVSHVAQRLSDLGAGPRPLSVGAVVGASLEEYADAGVERVMVTPWTEPARWRSGMTQCALDLGLGDDAVGAERHTIEVSFL